MNALLDESRDVRLEPGLPFLKQLRVSPQVALLLEAERAANESWGDFAVTGMIALATMRRTLRMDLRGAYRLLVGIVGATGAQEFPTDVRHAPDERRALAKAKGR